eukprot:5491816-Alexandrium_andersonii.AAC.1
MTLTEGAAEAGGVRQPPPARVGRGSGSPVAQSMSGREFPSNALDLWRKGKVHGLSNDSFAAL